MKNTFKFLGVIAVVAVIGFSMAACGGGGGGTAPEITTGTLPDGTVGMAYSQTLAASGDTPITWSLDGGTSLPAGLTLAATTGVISGTPIAAGTFNFTVKAINDAGNDTAALSITIAAATPAITTATLPGGTVGVAYSQTLAATGVTPITWSLDGGTSLPAGLSLAETTGVISGTPAAAGTFNFTVKATNDAGDDTKELTITIAAAAGGLSDYYGKWLSTTGTYQPYTLTVSADTVRLEDKDGDYIQYAGVEFTPAENTNNTHRAQHPDGYTFTGTRTASYGGSTSFGFIALSTDGQMVYLGTNAGTATTFASGPVFTKIVAPAITTEELPDGTLGRAYSQTLAATGNGLTWSLDGGTTLPAGLSLAPTTGVISGNPTAGGTFNFTVKAANAAGDDTKDLSIKINFIEMVQITGGTFTMGSPEDEPDRIAEDNSEYSLLAETQHQVTLTGFYMGKYEVTQVQYQTVMGTNPSAYRTGNTTNFPVEKVSWYDAIVFCNTLSIKEGLRPAYKIDGKTNPTEWGNVPTRYDSPGIDEWNAVEMVAGSTGYRLPTEAQWEYACRAGTITAFNTGNIATSDTGWFSLRVEDAALNNPREVGLKPANLWGLYDMHGNVLEWCWDWYVTYESGAQTDPTGAVSGVGRVLRGGAYNNYAKDARSARRHYGYPADNENNSFGFRVVLPAQSE